MESSNFVNTKDWGLNFKIFGQKNPIDSLDSKKAPSFGRGLSFILNIFTYPEIAFGIYTAKELPHPQVFFALGLFTEKPDPCRLST